MPVCSARSAHAHHATLRALLLLLQCCIRESDLHISVASCLCRGYSQNYAFLVSCLPAESCSGSLGTDYSTCNNGYSGDSFCPLLSPLLSLFFFPPRCAILCSITCPLPCNHTISEQLHHAGLFCGECTDGHYRLAGKCYECSAAAGWLPLAREWA